MKFSKIEYGNIGFIKILATLFLSVAVISCSNRLHDGNYNFEIYGTNDIHGRLFDSLYVGDSVYSHSLSKVSKYVKDARARGEKESVMLLDAGDLLQGDNCVYYFNYIDTASSHIVSDVFNYMNYDVAVVGNHDIEAGHKNYDKLVKELKMPYLAANAVSSSTGKPYFESYTILNRRGLKFAVIGATNPNIKSWLSENLYSGLDFLELKPLMQELVNSVRKEHKPDIVILVIHAGLGKADTYQMENPARYLAKNMDGVDIIFASHDHKRCAEIYPHNGYNTILLEGACKAEYLSLAELSVNVQGGKIVNKEILPKLIPMKDCLSDNEYNDHFYPQYKKVKDFSNKVVGKISKTIYSKEALTGPSEYVDMIHRVQLISSGADISFAAPLSKNITIPKGQINFQDLMSIYPYENQLYVIELTGREIEKYLNYSYTNWFANSVPFFNFDSAAGIVYEVHKGNKNGDLVRILSMEDGSAFDPDKKYRVAVTSYRASGGGDLLTKGAGIPKEQLESRIVKKMGNIRDLFYDYMRKYGEINPEIIGNWKIIQ